MEMSSWVIAAFTIVLAVTTIVYTTVTWRLLKRSEKAFKQSRTAFLVSVLDRMMNYVNQNTEKLGKETVRSYVIGQLAAIDQLDKDASEKLWEALAAWSSDNKYEIFVGRFEEIRKKGLYKEKAESGIKANSGSGEG